MAEDIAGELRGDNTEVDVRRAKEVRDLDPYDGVVVGASVHMGRLIGEVTSFLKRHQRVLARLSAAYFIVCLAESEDTSENRQRVAGYMQKMRDTAPLVSPLETKVFAGAVLTDTEEVRRLFFGIRFIAQSMARDLPDRRDWGAIRAWGRELALVLEAGQ
jgi:menaquinone-dependent protoporphyrinogen oxidase